MKHLSMRVLTSAEAVKSLAALKDRIALQHMIAARREHMRTGTATLEDARNLERLENYSRKRDAYEGRAL